MLNDPNSLENCIIEIKKAVLELLVCNDDFTRMAMGRHIVVNLKQLDAVSNKQTSELRCYKAWHQEARELANEMEGSNEETQKELDAVMISAQHGAEYCRKKIEELQAEINFLTSLSE